MKILLAAAGFLGVLLHAAAASFAEQPPLTAKEYWVDETGTASYEQAVHSSFVPFSGSISRGYSPAALWLKLRIAGQSGKDPLAVVVRPTFLRNIELYDPASRMDGAPPQPLISGRDAPVDADNHIGIDNGFIIPPHAEARDVVLRVTTTTALTVDVSVKPLEEAERASRVIAGTLAVYFAFLLTFCLWGLVSFTVHRDPIYTWFALRQLYAALHIFVWFGLLRYFFSDELSPSMRDLIHCFVMITTLPVTGLFDVKLLKDFGAAGWLRKVYIAILTLPIMSLLLLAMGKPQAALQTNNFVVTLAMLCILPLALSVRDEDNRPYGRLAVTVIRTGYSLISVVVLVPLLMYQNLISSKIQILNVLFAHAVISTCVMFAILSIRGRQREVLARNALLQYEIKARELEHESARRLEKERFLSMLTHELRNPLTVIRLMTNPDSATGKAVQKAAIDMTKVIERVELSEKAGDARMDVSKAPLELGGFIAALLRESAYSSRVDLDVEANTSIETDESILASVLQNLLENAAKYSPDGSPIRVSASSVASGGGAGLTLTVSNEVDAADLPEPDKLFTKYYRAPGAYRKPGSGLGLFLVDGWVRALGGTITYAHQRAAGGPASVSFRLWLPA